MGLFSNLKKAIFKKTAKKAKRGGRRRSGSLPKPAQKPENAPVDEPLSSDNVVVTPPANAEPSVPETVASQSSVPDSSTPQSEESETLTAAELSAQLDELEEEHPEDLKWRTSIVDLMKLVEMDSSYDERKEMALDLGYSQSDIDSKGSAEMNMWLHKKVMAKLSEDTDGDLTTA